MSPVLFSGEHIRQLDTITNKVTEMTNVSWWDKTSLDHPTHKEVTDPSGILAVGLVAFLRFCVFGMGKGNITGFLKDVEDGDPILTGRFHADEFTLILLKPFS